MIISIQHQDFFIEDSAPVGTLIKQLKNLKTIRLRKLGSDYVMVVSDLPVHFSVSNRGLVANDGPVSEKEFTKQDKALRNKKPKQNES